MRPRPGAFNPVTLSVATAIEVLTLFEHIADVVEDTGGDFGHAGLARGRHQRLLDAFQIGFSLFASRDIQRDSAHAGWRAGRRRGLPSERRWPRWSGHPCAPSGIRHSRPSRRGRSRPLPVACLVRVLRIASYQGSPLYSTFGMGGGSILDFTITPWLAPFVRGQYTSIPYAAGGASLQSAEGDLGLGFTLMPADKLYLRLEGMGGLAQLFSTAGSGAAFSAGGRLDVEYRFAPSWTISATGGYSTLSVPRLRSSRPSRPGSTSATTSPHWLGSSPVFRSRT